MRKILIVLLVVTLAGCVTFDESVRFQPIQSINGGYAEYQLYEDVWQIYYTTTPVWRRLGKGEAIKTAVQYLNMHASVITYDTGYDYFVPLNNSLTSERALDGNVAAVNSYGWGDVCFLTIKMGKGKMPKGVNAINAANYIKFMALVQ